MISNQKEYGVTKTQLARLENALDELRRHVDPDDEWFDVKTAAIESQASDLRQELAEYDRLRAGQVQSIEAGSIDELPVALIKARIARGLTQRQLAERLGIAEQQIQKYESSRYQSASFARLKDVTRALNINVTETVHIQNSQTA